ncbi:MAG: DNA-3-methyladenine glycosylase 2 family protein [Candidatus Thermoplasmatota archaeon]
MSLHELQPAAEARWSTTDKVLHKVSKKTPLDPDPQIAEADGFATLVTSIVHQQVSMAAARTIHGRLVQALGGKVTPRRVLNRTPDQLRAAGLSRMKAAFILDLADKTLRKEVEFARFPAMTDDEILAELTEVKGIGTWTAKMFLMFHLHRPDVLPFEDLGLRLAVSEVYGVPPEMAPQVMAEHREAWSPYCSVASRILWQSRRTPAK